MLTFSLDEHTADAYQLKTGGKLQMYGSGEDTDFVVTNTGLTAFADVVDVPTYWTDEGKYDTTLYHKLISADLAGTTVEISTPQELAALARAQDIDGIDFTGVTFKLTRGIDLDGCLWNPIGVSEGDTLHGAANGQAHPFKGNFKGNGYIVSNMAIQGSYVSAGLFGNVGDEMSTAETATAKVYSIADVTVSGTINVTNAAYIGGIVGYGGALILKNCVNQTSISGSSDIKSLATGGIIGYGMTIQLDSCVNKANTDIFWATESADVQMAVSAGIVGVVASGSIYNCANTASVAISTAADDPVLAGGISGFSVVSIVDNCYNTGAVTAGGDGSIAGGICGASFFLGSPMIEGDALVIQNCYNTGLVTAPFGGGIVGRTDSAIYNAVYLDGTATYAYSDFSGKPQSGASMSAEEMQAPAFCQTLNAWVDSPMPTSTGDAGLTGIDFLSWVQQADINNGYPVFENDPRLAASYALTVVLNGGSGATTGGTYASGAAVSINAGTRGGYTFSGWSSSNGGTFADKNSASTTFMMPENATTITANWTQNGADDGGYAPPANHNTIVIVDGKDHAIGTENKNGATTTATVDQGKLTDEIAGASGGSSVIFPVSPNANITAQLVVKNIEDMAKKDMTLTVQTGNISYNLDTTAIDTEAILEALGTTDAERIAFSIGISNSNAAVEGATVVVSPVAFTITCTYNGKTVTVDTFNSFVSRAVEITAEQANKITTGVVVNRDGTVRHVPTKVTVIGGKYYAVINSLTNSTYAVIWHPVEFEDVTTHWAKEAVNDMGSRMVVNGVGGNHYDPNRDITRAEFAAIVVRALGLNTGMGSSSFTDVSSSAWYYGYIQTAVGYGIITGYGDGTFGPNDTITREQAMTMTARAMKITKLAPTLTDSQIVSLLSKYTDASEISDYAKASVAACIDTGVILGKTNTTVVPKDFITRAEVAVIVERMLQKSGLI